MPLTDFLNASGQRVHAGVTGEIYTSPTGEIWIGKAAIRGVDTMLWGVLKHCVDVLGLRIWCSSIDTGQHAPASRHYQGRAVDISRVCKKGQPGDLATVENPEAVRLVNYLLAHGFRIGERYRGQQQPGVIFGPPHTKWNPIAGDHTHHIHVSLPKRRG
jgi:hypothetical protein